MSWKSFQDKRGFTITELLIVLVILGLIAAAVTPGLIGRFDRAKQRSAQLQLDTVSTALDSYYLDTGRYPSTDIGLIALLSPPADSVGWAGPYLKSQRSLVDPWGAPLRYELTGDNKTVVLTYGADGREGGEGLNADLRVPELLA
jgi:general secretion pathway protein G